MVDYTKPIAESKNFIVLDKYTKTWEVNESYQSEAELERELIEDLKSQGYEYDSNLNNPEKIESFLKEAALVSGATIVSVHTNLFNPHGVSGVVIIAESHITIHTWPEHGYAAVDAFTCGDSVDTMKVADVLEDRLRAQSIETKIFKRGLLGLKI